MPARAPTVKKMMPHTHRTASEGRSLVNSTLTLARLPPGLPLIPAAHTSQVCPHLSIHWPPESGLSSGHAWTAGVPAAYLHCTERSLKTDILMSFPSLKISNRNRDSLLGLSKPSQNDARLRFLSYGPGHDIISEWPIFASPFMKAFWG